MTTRGLVEGALLAGLATILVLLGNFPFIGLFFLLFCSIPITVVTVRHSTLTGAISSALTVLIIALLLGPLSAISGGLQYILLGWVMGYMLYHHKSGSKTLHAVVITAAIASIVLVILSLGLIGFTQEAMTAYINDYTTEMMHLYQNSGMLEMMIGQGVSEIQVTQMLQQSIQIVLHLLPAIIIISRSVMALITYFLTAQVLKRLKIRIPRVQNFKKWGLPASSVWGLIFFWALWLAGDYIQISWINILALNCLVIYGALLFLNGFALACYWFKFSQMSLPIKIIGTLFVLFFISGFMIACILMGLADLLFDFRKLRVDNKKVSKG